MKKMSHLSSHLKKRASRYGLFIGFTCIIGGSAIILPSLYYQNKSSAGTTVPLEIKTVALHEQQRIIQTGKPVRLVIPTVNIDLSVIDGVYDESAQVWNVSNDSAHFATITTQPNDFDGNTFIYGHLRESVFYRLPKTVIGAEAVVYTDNDLVFHYTLTAVSETNPQDVSALLAPQEQKPILTLQTCSGAWYQNRQLFTFDFDFVENVQNVKLSSI